MVDPVQKHTSEPAGDCESAIILTDDIPLFQSQAFLHRVYFTLTLQLLISITTLLVFSLLISDSGSSGTNFSVRVISATVVLFIGIGLLYRYRKETPASYVLLCLCTLGISYLLALSCTYFLAAGQMSGLKILLESWCLTSIAFVSLSCHALKAARKGRDFRFLELYLLKAAIALMLLLLFLLILYPQRGRLLCHLTIAGFGSTVYSFYIVYFTHELVVTTRFPNEHNHIWASLSLYIYVIALFLFFVLIVA